MIYNLVIFFTQTISGKTMIALPQTRGSLFENFIYHKAGKHKTKQIRHIGDCYE